MITRKIILLLLCNVVDVVFGHGQMEEMLKNVVGSQKTQNFKSFDVEFIKQ
ncbi:MAG: hypothetical protein H6Q18_186 [Bacteroidetes bacterium]|nr:hypothetical protein [Bacteroidota bacterium]